MDSKLLRDECESPVCIVANGRLVVTRFLDPPIANQLGVSLPAARLLARMVQYRAWLGRLVGYIRGVPHRPGRN